MEPLDNAGERDQFARIELHQQLVRDREIVAMYEDHLAQLRDKIEDKKYALGRLDERLGSDAE